MRRTLASLLTACGMTAAALTFAPAAHAAGNYGCSGSLIDSYEVGNQGSNWGTTYLYYDASSGENCAVTVKSDLGYKGTASLTRVQLERCSSSTPHVCGDTDASVEDSGQYAYYAGPITLNAAGKCINIATEIWDPTQVEVAATSRTAVHCG
ncbi:hypothetical protein [Streptomyces sp. TR06-5]|uniref:hypothetical protein n=1 Tax=unclassified Streptomyces TaxID=2593676 RepID=UPI0039A2D9AD